MKQLLKFSSKHNSQPYHQIQRPLPLSSLYRVGEINLVNEGSVVFLESRKLTKIIRCAQYDLLKNLFREMVAGSRQNRSIEDGLKFFKKVLLAVAKVS